MMLTRNEWILIIGQLLGFIGVLRLLWLWELKNAAPGETRADVRKRYWRDTRRAIFSGGFRH